MSFLFDHPIFFGFLVILLLVTAANVGLTRFRKNMLPRLRFGESDAHFSGAMVASIMVFYGLAMALIAVHVWETYEEVASITTHEASTLAALYRNVSGYPEPLRTSLQSGIREYVEYTISDAWPAQRHGLVPTPGIAMMDKIEETLTAYEPASESQKLLAAETLAGYTRMIEVRRERLDAIKVHLPGPMWIVIVLGAIVGLISTFLFPVVDPRLHRTQVTLLSVFIGVIIFLVLALDRPFRGELGVTAEPYKLIHEQLMTQ